MVEEEKSSIGFCSVSSSRCLYLKAVDEESPVLVATEAILPKFQHALRTDIHEELCALGNVQQARYYALNSNEIWVGADKLRNFVYSLFRKFSARQKGLEIEVPIIFK